MSKDGASRDRFNNKIEYFLTALSYAVGLGNVWRFPYLCYRNGGGSFLIPYMLSLAILGLPFFFFESSIGQFTSLGPIKVWRLTPIFKGIGYAMFLMGAYVGIYYNIVIAWSFYYVYSSFTSLPTVPWATCSNEWNSANCVDAITKNVSTINQTSPSQEFFYKKVLQMTSGLDDMGPLHLHLVLCLAIAWILIYCGLCLGTKSLGKVSYFTAFFPYVMITALLIKGVQLEGSIEGILHYISPNFEKLKDINVWSDAATQIFYSLSICMGGVITLASYNSFHNNLFQDSIIIVICNSLTSVYAGFAIFSVIGFMANQIGKSVSEAADQGVGLAFVAYPAALARLPYPPFWSVIFFLMIITLGFGSQMTIVETTVSTLVDFWPDKLQKRKPIVLAFVCFILFLAGLPMCTGSGIYILQLMDTYSVPYSAFFIAIAELIAIAWVYGIDIHLKNIYRMVGYKIWPQAYWKFMFKFGCPVLIIGMLLVVIIQHEPLTYNNYVFPPYAEYVGWAMTFSSVLLIPLMAFYECSKVVRKQKTIKDILRPDVTFEGDLSTDESTNKSFDSITSIEKSYPEDLNNGQDNHGFNNIEHFKWNNLNHINNFGTDKKAKLLNFSSISTWTCGNNSDSTTKLPMSPSLQDVFSNS